MKICEIFRSLQGEGTLIGTPTVFVRTAGCNLECAWCDTPYSKKAGDEMTIPEILEKVKAFEIHYVCVTGGEPMIQEGSVKLIDELLGAGYHVTVETNGSISLEDLPCSMSMLISMDIKCPTSGMAEQMDLSNLELLSPLDQLKFVVANREDMMYAAKLLHENKVECTVIFTPVGGLALEPVADFVLKKKLNVRVLPQLHKLIWGDKRGV
jgi:7-carboxy-7-deazaguanine synthase